MISLKGKVFSPKGKLKFPKGEMVLLKGKFASPTGKLASPHGFVPLPVGFLEIRLLSSCQQVGQCFVFQTLRPKVNAPTLRVVDESEMFIDN